MFGGSDLDFFLVNHGNVLAHATEAGQNASLSPRASARHFEEDDENDDEDAT
jgi:hypothetical protein